MSEQAITVREVTRENWWATLALAVRPEQQRFVADYAPIAAVALAKAYIRPGGLVGLPMAFYAGEELVGFALLAYAPESVDEYWLFHFFIDARSQGRGYGRAALAAWIKSVHARFPACQALRLVVHPENTRARQLYLGAGFQPTGGMRWGEPEYRLELREHV